MTAEGPLDSFLKTLGRLTWPRLRRQIAEKFISADFSKSQREALDGLSQRPGEYLVKFNHTFWQLIKEAYDQLPEDQTALIRSYLSALSDRKAAIAIIKTKPATLEAAIQATEERNRGQDFLRPQQRIGRTVLIDDEPEQSSLFIKTFEQTNLAHLEAKTTAAVKAISSRPSPPPPSVPRERSGSRSKRKPPLGECYHCGDTGHWASHCRAPRRPFTKPTPQSTPSPHLPTSARIKEPRFQH